MRMRMRMRMGGHHVDDNGESLVGGGVDEKRHSALRGVAEEAVQ